jgi:hypothetical protein
MLLSPMFSSPISSPTNRSPVPPQFHSNLCHPERSEESAFLFSPIRALSVFLASPLFSYSCALFCNNENDNLFAFRRFHTLFSKHPGGGLPSSISSWHRFQISPSRQSSLTNHQSPPRLFFFHQSRVTNHESLSPLQSALTQIAPVTPVESALTKKPGEGPPPKISPIRPLGRPQPDCPRSPKSTRPEDHSVPPRHQPSGTAYRSLRATSRIRQAGV